MGFECTGSFMIGAPFETAEDIKKTLDFIKELKLDAVQIGIATPFPGTKLWDDGKKIGKISSDEWSDDYFTFLSFFDGVEKIRNKKFRDCSIRRK